MRRQLVRILIGFVLALFIAAMLSLMVSAPGSAGSMLTAVTIIVVVCLVFSPGILLLIGPILSGVRRRRAQGVLDYLTRTVRANLPLAPMLKAAGAAERSTLGLRLAELGQRLRSGERLAEALPAAVPEAPRRTVSMVAAAERTGRLPQTLSYLADEQRDREPREATDDLFLRLYVLADVFTLAWVLSATAVFVFPKLKEIFSDYDSQMPALTTAVFGIAEVAGGPLFFTTLLAAVLYLLYLLYELIWGGRRGLTLGPFKALFWYVPVIGHLQRDRGYADVCFTMRQGLLGGLTEPQALAEAVQLRLNPVLRARVRAWAQYLSGGASLQAAAKSANMPALVSGMLGPGVDVPQSLSFLSRYYTARVGRLASLLAAAALPTFVILMAVLAGTVIVSFFLPMVALIDANVLHAGL